MKEEHVGVDVAEAAQNAAAEALRAKEEIEAKLAAAVEKTVISHLHQLKLPKLNPKIVVDELDDIPTFEETKAVLDRFGIRYEIASGSEFLDDGLRPGRELGEIIRMAAAFKMEDSAEQLTALAIAKKLENMSQAEYDASADIINEMMIEVGIAARRVAAPWLR